MIGLDLISSLCINNQYVTELTNFETFITTRSYPMVPKTKEALSPYADERASLQKKWRPPTLPHCIAVPSAQAGLTSLFGMGRGGTPPQ